MTPGTPQQGLPRILVVDDEEIVLVAIRETLRREGYVVVTALDGLAGLVELKKMPFDAIISDNAMPKLSGLEFFVQAKEIQPDVPRILTSAVLAIGTVIDAINKAEIHRFILKPWRKNDLLSILRIAVQRHHAVRLIHQRLAEALEVSSALRSENASLRERLGLQNAAPSPTPAQPPGSCPPPLLATHPTPPPPADKRD